MFCEKCGKPVDMDQNICAECAAKEQTPPVAAQAEESIVLDRVTEEPKKNKKGLLIGIVAAVVALAVLAVVLCMGPLKGLFVKNFGSPADYLLYVEEQAAAEGIEDFVEVYTTALDNVSKAEEYSVNSQMHLLVGDALLNLLEQSLASQGVSAELDFLSDIAINMDMDLAKEQLAAQYGLGLGDKNIADINIYMDYEGEKLLLGIPTLSESYLQLPIENMAGANVAEMAALYKLLPSAETTAKVLETYTGILRKHFTRVEQSEEAFTVEGVEQKLTVLTVTLTIEDLNKLALEIMETAQTDADLEKFLDALSVFINAVNEMQYGQYKNVPGLESLVPETVDIHAEMVEAIPEAIEEAREYQDEALDGNYLQLTTFVDSKHQICGRTLEVFEENISIGLFHYLTTEDQNGSALEAKIVAEEEEALYVVGTYTDTDNILSGSFDITVAQIHLLTLELTDCTEEKLQMKLIPTDTFLKDVLELDDSATAVLGLTSPCLEIIYAGNDTTAKMELYLKAGDTMLAGISLDSTMTDYAPDALPQGPFVDGEDTDALISWSSELNVEKLLDNLIAAGISEELIQSLLSSLMGA